MEATGSFARNFASVRAKPELALPCSPPRRPLALPRIVGFRDAVNWLSLDAGKNPLQGAAILAGDSPNSNRPNGSDRAPRAETPELPIGSSKVYNNSREQ